MQQQDLPVIAAEKPLVPDSFKPVAQAETDAIRSRVLVAFSNQAIYFGGIGVMAGAATLLTVVFAPVGVVIGAAGICAILVGLAGKLAHHLMYRWHSAVVANAQKDSDVSAGTTG